MRVFFAALVAGVGLSGGDAAGQRAQDCPRQSIPSRRLECFEAFTDKLHTCHTIPYAERLACFDRWAQQSGAAPAQTYSPTPAPSYVPPPPQAYNPPAPVAPPVPPSPAQPAPARPTWGYDHTRPANPTPPAPTPAPTYSGAGGGGQFGPNDLEEIVQNSQNQEARFRRDYKGRSFSGVMPFSRITPGYRELNVYFGERGFRGKEIVCRFPQQFEAQLADFNAGDSFQIRGTIDDTTLGMLRLNGCQVNRVNTQTQTYSPPPTPAAPNTNIVSLTQIRADPNRWSRERVTTEGYIDMIGGMLMMTGAEFDMNGIMVDIEAVKDVAIRTWLIDVCGIATRECRGRVTGRVRTFPMLTIKAEQIERLSR